MKIIDDMFKKKSYEYIELHFGEKLCHSDHRLDIEEMMRWAYGVGKKSPNQSIKADHGKRGGTFTYGSAIASAAKLLKDQL